TSYDRSLVVACGSGAGFSLSFIMSQLVSAEKTAGNKMQVIIATRDAALIEWFERSEEHTSELQSRFDLVCRLLLEKKKKICSYLLLFFLPSSVPALSQSHTLSLHDALPIYFLRPESCCCMWVRGRFLTFFHHVPARQRREDCRE